MIRPFFFEHRALLDTSEGRRPYPGDDFCLPFGQAASLLQGDELTVVTWGAMVARCLEAARPFAGRVSLLDLRTIIPWDQEAVLESVRQTGKALIVHEDTLTDRFRGRNLRGDRQPGFHRPGRAGRTHRCAGYPDPLQYPHDGRHRAVGGDDPGKNGQASGLLKAACPSRTRKR